MILELPRSSYCHELLDLFALASTQLVLSKEKGKAERDIEKKNNIKLCLYRNSGIC